MTQTVSLGDIIRAGAVTMHNKLRAPLNSRQRAEMQGEYAYYGATGQMDSVNNYRFDGFYVLVAEDGTVYGANGICPMIQRVKGKFWVSNHAHVLQGKDMVDTQYLALALEASDVRPHITGAVQLKLSKENLLKLRLYWPERGERERTLNSINPLDEKIELNRKMNDTLEQMGEAVFRHYFIHNPDAHKWVDGNIANLGEVITGKTPSKAKAEYYGTDVMFLKVPDMHEQPIIVKTEDMLSSHGAESQSKKYIPKWSTCVSCIATVGVVSIAGEQLQTNQQINSIVPRADEYTIFNYYLIKSKSGLLKTMASGGSATPNLNKGHFERIKIKLPPADLLNKFQIESENLLKLLDENTRQIQILVSLRDGLLPRLISGKVSI